MAKVSRSPFYVGIELGDLPLLSHLIILKHMGCIRFTHEEIEFQSNYMTCLRSHS